jgi:outer membrane protein OmpA-like peptidoglycan-associated protein
VHEKDKAEGIPDAIVRYRGSDLTAMATSADGRFISTPLPAEAYTFDVSADGYKSGECSVTLTDVAPAATPPAATATTPPAAPAVTPPASSPPAAPSSSADRLVDVDCQLEALPRVGTVTGRVINLDDNTPIANANVELTDSLSRTLKLTTDGSGAFRFERVFPGPLTLKAEADDYLFHTQALELHAREEAHPELGLHKRPKVSLVQVDAKELKIKQQIHFENDSAVILGDSNALLEQIADALARNPGIAQVEIQGHTDNAGTPEHNLTLSEARANAVVAWLVAHGIDQTRLVARGYGQERPIAPNLSVAGRARNRRVQFMITR